LEECLSLPLCVFAFLCAFARNAYRLRPTSPEAARRRSCSMRERRRNVPVMERERSSTRGRPQGGAVPDRVGTKPGEGELVLVRVEAVPLHIRLESDLVGRKASKGFQQGVNILIELVPVGPEVEPVGVEEVPVVAIPLLVEPELSISPLRQRLSESSSSSSAGNRRASGHTLERAMSKRTTKTNPPARRVHLKAFERLRTICEAILCAHGPWYFD
jgi:hypothetical protein